MTTRAVTMDYETSKSSVSHINSKPCTCLTAPSTTPHPSIARGRSFSLSQSRSRRTRSHSPLSPTSSPSTSCSPDKGVGSRKLDRYQPNRHQELENNSASAPCPIPLQSLLSTVHQLHADLTANQSSASSNLIGSMFRPDLTELTHVVVQQITNWQTQTRVLNTLQAGEAAGPSPIISTNPSAWTSIPSSLPSLTVGGVTIPPPSTAYELLLKMHLVIQLSTSQLITECNTLFHIIQQEMQQFQHHQQQQLCKGHCQGDGEREREAKEPQWMFFLFERALSVLSCLRKVRWCHECLLSYDPLEAPAHPDGPSGYRLRDLQNIMRQRWQQQITTTSTQQQQTLHYNHINYIQHYNHINYIQHFQLPVPPTNQHLNQ